MILITKEQDLQITYNNNNFLQLCSTFFSDSVVVFTFYYPQSCLCLCPCLWSWLANGIYVNLVLHSCNHILCLICLAMTLFCFRLYFGVGYVLRLTSTQYYTISYSGLRIMQTYVCISIPSRLDGIADNCPKFFIEIFICIRNTFWMIRIANISIV